MFLFVVSLNLQVYNELWYYPQISKREKLYLKMFFVHFVENNKSLSESGIYGDWEMEKDMRIISLTNKRE